MAHFFRTHSSTHKLFWTTPFKRGDHRCIMTALPEFGGSRRRIKSLKIYFAQGNSTAVLEILKVGPEQRCSSLSDKGVGVPGDTPYPAVPVQDIVCTAGTNQASCSSPGHRQHIPLHLLCIRVLSLAHYHHHHYSVFDNVFSILTMLSRDTCTKVLYTYRNPP